MNLSPISSDLMDFLKSVASESRVKILLLFIDGQSRTVNQITEAIGLGQSTVSEHLSIMKNSGLLLSNKQGKEVYYQPDRDKIIYYIDSLREILVKCCNL